MDEARFVELLLSNAVIRTVLERMPQLGLPDSWLVSSSLMLTVWNVEDGRDPQTGIRDYDLIYFDDSDLSYDAEDVAIGRAQTLFGDLDAEIEVRNQARVHLWFEERNGIPYPALRDSREAIDRFLGRAHALGVRQDRAGGIVVYAPYGFDDLARRIVRRSPAALGPRATYEAKAARWKTIVPELRIEPW